MIPCRALLPRGAGWFAANDITREQPRDFTVRKETLWESETTSDSEVSLKEAVYVRALKSNAASVG